jgi:hypothetical protein
VWLAGTTAAKKILVQKWIPPHQLPFQQWLLTFKEETSLGHSLLQILLLCCGIAAMAVLSAVVDWAQKTSLLYQNIIENITATFTGLGRNPTFYKVKSSDCIQLPFLLYWTFFNTPPSAKTSYQHGRDLTIRTAPWIMIPAFSIRTLDQLCPPCLLISDYCLCGH